MKLAVMIVLALLSYSAMMGSRVAISLTALKLTDSTLITGMLVAMFSVLPIFLGLSVGRLLDRFGLMRPIFGAMAVSLLGMLAPFIYPSVWTLAFSSAANGIAFMTAALAMTNAGALIGRVEERTRNLSWIFLGNSFGMGIGPLITGFGIDHAGHRETFLLLALLPALAIVLLLAAGRFIPGGRGSGKPAAGNLMECLREPALRSMLLSQVLMSGCLEGFYFIVPLHGTRVGLSATTIGFIISCAFVANFTTRSFMPMLLRHVNESTLVAAMFLVAGISIAPFALFSNPAMLMVLSAGVGICHGVALPILSSLIFTASPAGRQGEVGGVRTMLTSVTIGMTQLLAGAFSSVIGIAPVAGLIAAMAFGGSWFVRQRVRSHVRAP